MKKLPPTKGVKKATVKNLATKPGHDSKPTKPASRSSLAQHGNVRTMADFRAAMRLPQARHRF